MLAEQPSRLERALRALSDLADHLQKRGGPRLALVVFAARPHLVFPLTRDYDHFRTALGELEAGDLPADIYPDARNPPDSGTRIGAALTLAVASFEEEPASPGPCCSSPTATTRPTMRNGCRASTPPGQPAFRFTRSESAIRPKKVLS